MGRGVGCGAHRLAGAMGPALAKDGPASSSLHRQFEQIATITSVRF